MRCAWDAYLRLIPVHFRKFVDMYGRETLLELRLRLGKKPELITVTGSIFGDTCIKKEDLSFTINTASQYSPWASTTITQGYITAPGGHRVGICGTMSCDKEGIHNVSTPTSVCLRVSRDFPGLSKNIGKDPDSILILGKPGSGKTTLLRDLIRQKSNAETGSICVVDEKEEIFPSIGTEFCFDTGERTDVISGCSKKQGIEAVLRNMGPAWIAVDEITAQEDCEALLHAGWCGVKLIATAHASGKEDLLSRAVYSPIAESRLFTHLIVLREDKSWYQERMYL